MRRRFRPIFVSVSTTIMGMAPLLLETSTQAQTLKPLVISVWPDGDDMSGMGGLAYSN